VAEPLRIGLTGSIGMGKSETAKLFARLGVPAYDADAAVHMLYEKDGAAVAPVGEAFPNCVKDGEVDRKALGERVMGDAQALARLEAIVHPLVLQVEQAFIARAKAQGADLVVLDIPLLFETGAERRFDAVVVVSAPDAVQWARVMARPGMSQDRFARILSRQLPDAEKRARADYVVDTGQGLEHAFAQVRRIVEELRAKSRLRDA